jgi:transglutaminase-like putative cysteine protease
MFYAIRHVTRYRYSAIINESVMEVRTQPRSELSQRLVSFELAVTPKARALSYGDYLGNMVHTFDIPGAHRQLTITARSLLKIDPLPTIPERLPMDAWDALDAIRTSGEQWDWLVPSQMTEPSTWLRDLEREVALPGRAEIDPLTAVRRLNEALYGSFSYTPNSTNVDSPMDDALRTRRGVCQDFTHIMLAITRGMGIPARYISGYISRRRASDRAADDATHAWVEVFLPTLGWVGFDPTNNTIADEWHIRVAVGRDYKDVPPTRGTFKGKAESALDVAVQVVKLTHLEDETQLGSIFNPISFPPPQFAPMPDDPIDEAVTYTRFQQMQQQQQQ